MTEYTPSSEFEKEIWSALTVPDASLEFVDTLRSTLQRRSVQPKGRVGRPRLAWIVIALVLAITISIAAIGPQKVLAAFERLLGYIPGIGLVEQGGGLRVLAEPVELEREGIIVRVEEVVADSNHTVVVLSVENLPREALVDFFASTPTGSIPLLALPDNTLLEPIGGEGNGWMTGYHHRMIFPVLSKEVNHIMLLIPILNNMPEGAAPEDWLLQLDLVPAPPDLTLMPVYEIAPIKTQRPEVIIENGLLVEVTPETPAEDKEIQLVLDRVIELENGFLFQGQISWLRETGFTNIEPWNFTLRDGEGQEIPVERAYNNDEIGWYKRYSRLWAFQTNSKNHPGPWTLSLDQVNVEQTISDVFFNFDLGDDPQLDQKWELSKMIEVIGTQIELTQVEMYGGTGREEKLTWLKLSFKTPKEIMGITIADSETISFAGSRRGGEGIISSGHTYYEMPRGVRQLEIVEIRYKLDGSWQINWQPPVEEDQDATLEIEVTEICLTFDVWEEIRSQPMPAFPTSLDGHLLLQTNTGQMLPQISLLSLSTMTSETFGIGAWSSLSPDGSKIAFSRGDGLFVADAISGNENQLTGIPEMADYPIWSEDSNSILFLSYYEHAIYRINTDSSGLEKVVEVPSIIYPSGLVPGENILYYVAHTQAGVGYRSIDLQTGTIENLIQTDNTKPNSRPKLSPDGEWYLYSDRIFGQTQINSMIARPDGSDKKVLTTLDSDLVTPGGWSPDGQWVIVNVYQIENNTSTITPVLIQPNTCEVIPLLDLQGKVTAWGP